MDTSKNYLSAIRDNWPIILFLGALVFGWANIQNSIKDNTDAIEQNKQSITLLNTRYDATQADVSNISGDIKEINASLSFIKARLAP